MNTRSSRGSYGATLLLALIAIPPILINFTALDMVSPTIAQHLGVSPADASWEALLGNAAFVFGLVIAADLTRRLTLRNLIIGALALFAVSSVCAALAPNLVVLIVARIVQGFSAGVVTNAIVFSLFNGFPTGRVPITVAVLGIGLFGAATIGPLLGGLAEQTEMWRALFVLDGLVAVTAMLLARIAVPQHPAPEPRASFDVAGALLSALGITFLFIGVGELAYHLFAAAEVEVPVLIGIGALLLLFAADRIQHDPLLPVRETSRPATISAIVAASVAAIGFGGLFGVLVLFLQQIRGLGAEDTGVLLWPAPIAALVGSVFVGLIFRRRHWTLAVAVGGVVLLAVAAWLLTSLTRFTGDESIMLVAGLMGLGASMSIAPPILVEVINLPVQILARAFACITLLPYLLLAGSRTVLTYLVRVRQTIHSEHLLWEQGSNLMFSVPSPQGQAVASDQFAGPLSYQATNTGTQALAQTAFVLGINDAAALVAVILVLGALASVLLLLTDRPAAHRVNARHPDLSTR